MSAGVAKRDDEDEWPPEATLLVTAYHGNVRRLKEIARRLDEDGRGVASTLRRTTFDGMNALHATWSRRSGWTSTSVTPLKVLTSPRLIHAFPFSGRTMTSLQHAVFSGNLPVVRYLLDHHADVHQETHLECREGSTALHTAAKKGRCEIAKFLLSRGAHVDGKSCRVTPPLHLAVLGGHDSALKILLDHHADLPRSSRSVNPECIVKDITLRTPSLSCLKLLIQVGAEVNGIAGPLARAAQEGLTEATKLLLEAGANPNIPDML
ncbi:LOW QUALITY PROTEIN: uncharacterized protein LOC133914635 [Phragmites australis]|uniref:LOW QUALITY PROTEIN: uncharacterized protein LOC133914635 n=1 Tax=Phragmites australis TaxID=29695 RepID=UPI002D7772A2|nr:LOW QUALITY PROTEIN: uncharacterized protein LOC133914635 [Phragmites australis]